MKDFDWYNFLCMYYALCKTLCFHPQKKYRETIYRNVDRTNDLFDRGNIWFLTRSTAQSGLFFKNNLTRGIPHEFIFIGKNRGMIIPSRFLSPRNRARTYCLLFDKITSVRLISINNAFKFTNAGESARVKYVYIFTLFMFAENDSRVRLYDR